MARDLALIQDMTWANLKVQDFFQITKIMPRTCFGFGVKLNEMYTLLLFDLDLTLDFDLI